MISLFIESQSTFLLIFTSARNFYWVKSLKISQNRFKLKFLKLQDFINISNKLPEARWLRNFFWVISKKNSTFSINYNVSNAISRHLSFTQCDLSCWHAWITNFYSQPLHEPNTHSNMTCEWLFVEEIPKKILDVRKFISLSTRFFLLVDQKREKFIFVAFFTPKLMQSRTEIWAREISRN